MLENCKIINYQGTKETSIEDLIPENEKFQYVRCEVNDRLRELSYKIKEPAKIELFKLAGDVEGMLIYKNTLMFVLAMALHNLFPSTKMLFSNDVSRSIYIRPVENEDFPLKNIRALETEVNRLIKSDIKIEKKLISKEKAIEIYKKEGLLDKLGILSYRNEDMVHLYQADNYYDYFYGYMLPSTGYLTSFNIIPRIPGFLVQYPRSEENGKIPPFVAEPIYEKTLEEARDFSTKVGLSTIFALNNFAKKYSDNDFIQMSESNHNNQLAALGDLIANSKSEIKLICIAGPSSSGKTTFANRLRLELISRGIFPIRISLDDYYKDKKEIKPDANGKYDYESLDCLRVDYFNNQLLDLLSLQEVDVPIYDFNVGKATKTRKLKLSKHQPIIIEGIHALTEEMTISISKQNKFKIFIAPQAQVNIDDHSPISLTDLRLIRRIVRDAQFRNSKAEETIQMWPSVRQGEFTWIYKNQQQADFVFNSFLPYELLILKKYALPLLSEIDKKSPYYVIARRLILFLKYFSDVNEDLVPNCSLLREFIGKSCFKDV